MSHFFSNQDMHWSWAVLKRKLIDAADIMNSVKLFTIIIFNGYRTKS